MAASETSMYQLMKARGVNMSWYEKGKRGRSSDVVPLDDEQCSALSIYFLKKDGSLWTITYKGAVYQQVRPATKELPKEVYICLHCKTQWSDAPINAHDEVKHPVTN